MITNLIHSSTLLFPFSIPPYAVCSLYHVSIIFFGPRDNRTLHFHHAPLSPLYYAFTLQQIIKNLARNYIHNVFYCLNAWCPISARRVHKQTFDMPRQLPLQNARKKQGPCHLSHSSTYLDKSKFIPSK